MISSKHFMTALKHLEEEVKQLVLYNNVKSNKRTMIAYYKQLIP